MNLKLKENAMNCTDLEVETFYSKGGMNYFTYEDERRGYYVECSPVEIGNNCITRGLFDGAKIFIEPAKRFNKKRMAQLDEMTLENAKDLIQYVLEKNGLELEDEQILESEVAR